MKKYIMLLFVQLLFYFISIIPSFMEEIFNKQEIALESYKKINPAEVSNKDAAAYTKLAQLHVRTYDLCLAIQADYSHEYVSSRRELLHDSITKARTIQQSIEDENISTALQYSLTFADEIISM